MKNELDLLNKELEEAKKEEAESAGGFKKFFKKPLFITTCIMSGLDVAFMALVLIVRGVAGFSTLTDGIIFGSLFVLPLIATGCMAMSIFAKHSKTEKIKNKINKLEKVALKTNEKTKELDNRKEVQNSKAIIDAKNKENKITPPIKISNITSNLTSEDVKEK